MAPAARIRRRLPVSLFAVAALATLPLAAQSQGGPFDDVCFPDRFSVRYAVYPADTLDQNRNLQHFDLQRGRERFDTFQSGSQVISFLDDFSTNTRFILLGTHENEGNIAFTQCTPTPLSRSLAPVCPGKGLDRRASFPYGAIPVHQSVLFGSPPNDRLVLIDALWTRIGTVTVPLQVVERMAGSSLQFIRFENLRFDFDAAELDIPQVCPPTAQKSEEAVHLRDVFPDSRWHVLQRAFPYRYLFPEDD